MTLRQRTAVALLSLSCSAMTVAAATAQPAPAQPPRNPGAGANNPGTRPPAQPVNPAGPGFNAIPAHPLFAGIPGIENISAPEWIQPGTRLIFWGAAGTIVNEAGQTTLIPDPNGEWIDEVTGERFTQSEVHPGTAGAGYSVID